MTVRECYEKIGSDFDKVLGRMGSEGLQLNFWKTRALRS